MSIGKRKLEFELVPDGCWKYNLRNILSQKLWNYIKKEAKERSGERCAICGAKSSRLEAHEKWNYDIKNGIITLEDVVAVCPLCHKAIHIGRTSLTGDVEKVEDHYMAVNKVTYVEMKHDLHVANVLHKQRNQVNEWKMNLDWLKRFV